MRHHFINKYQQIGKAIAFYRQQRRLSQAELSNLLKAEVRLIQGIEALGTDNPQSEGSPWAAHSFYTVFMIAEALQIDAVAFLLPVSEENFHTYRTDL